LTRSGLGTFHRAPLRPYRRSIRTVERGTSMQGSVKRSIVGVVAAALVAALAVPTFASSSGVTKAPVVPAYAMRGNLVGHASGPVEFRVVLRWRDQAGLLRTIAA